MITIRSEVNTMPTGYAAPISDGITFAEYAMTCARAFGANVSMRDDPSGTPILEYNVAPYYQERVEEAERALAQLKALTPLQRVDAANDDHQKHLKLLIDQHERRSQLQSRYEAMLDQVNAWIPPTPDHEELKRFMAEQIEQSLRFDCDASRCPELETTQVDVTTWYREAVERAEQSLTYRRRSLESETNRVARANDWNRKLRESLLSA